MSKITTMTEATAPSSGDDLVEIVIDTATTPLNRRMKLLNLLKRIFLADATQLTWGAVVDGEFLKREGTTITSDPVSTGPATQIQETGGPTVLDVAAIVDGEFLKRVGTDIVSAAPSGGGGAVLTENLTDTKISALTAATTALGTDLLVIVDDPAGTPVTKRITKTNLLQPEVNQGEDLASSSKRWAVTYSAQFNAKAGDEYRWEGSSRLIDLGDGFLLYRSNAGGTVKLSLGDSSSSATMIKRNGIVLEVRLGDDSAYGPLMAGSVRTNPVTFANRPATPIEGMLVTVTDSSTATWGATITGGGANRVLAYYNGTNWTVAAI